MIIAAIWIGGLTLMKGFSLIELSVEEIILSGITIAAVFSPVYFNILIDKIVGKKRIEE